MHGEKLVERFGAHKVVVRDGELDANDHRHQARDDKEEQHANDVHEAELLVIGGGDPAIKICRTECSERLRAVFSSG